MLVAILTITGFSWIRSICCFTCSIPVVVIAVLFLNPVDIYSACFQRDPKSALVEAKLADAVELHKNAEYEEAAKSIEAIYRDESDNLLVVLSYIAEIRSSYLGDLLKSREDGANPEVKQQARKRFNDIISGLNKATQQQFPNISAVQIFAGDTFAVLGECASASVAYRTAFGAE
jgi:methionine synthase II (cobalamin-independent)